jgi:hypothetical protein
MKLSVPVLAVCLSALSGLVTACGDGGNDTLSTKEVFARARPATVQIFVGMAKVPEAAPAW